MVGTKTLLLSGLGLQIHLAAAEVAGRPPGGTSEIAGRRHDHGASHGHEGGVYRDPTTLSNARTD